MDKIYTVEQVSEMIRMHPKTIQRYIREGKINAQKVGKSWRITENDLTNFLKKNQSEKELPAYKMNKSEDKIKISAVIDIDIESREEAINIINMITATQNPEKYDLTYSNLSVQFIELEKKIRIMLWGNINYISNMMENLSAITE